MSTPSRLPTDYPTWLLQSMSLFIKYRPKTNEAPGSGWFDKAAYQGHIAYPQNPVRSGAELKKLTLEMRAALPIVNVPVLLMHSKDERYILSKNMEEIYAALVNTPDKTKLYITGSGHVLPRDASREQVFKSAVEFIQRIHNS
jgi:esterase/lipase